MTLIDNNANAAGNALSRVFWGAIFAGSAVSVALMILFATFGLGIGSAVMDPQFDRNPTAGMPASAGIYLIVTQLIALAAGGYIAARLAGVPRTISSVLHGASVWAIATIFLAWASVIGAGSVFGAAGTLMSSSASAISSSGDAVMPDDISLPRPSELIDDLSMGDLPEEAQTTLRENGITEQNLRTEAKAAFRNVFSRDEQAEAVALAKSTLQDVVTSPGDIGADLDAFADDLLGGPDAIISDEDRQEALAVMERRLGITPQEAQQIVDTVDARVEAAVAEVRDVAQKVQTKAVETVQAASDAVAAIALLLSLASVLGLAAACGGAFAGKPDSLVGDRLDDHV
ncbi:hypothetical protein [Aestuariivita sp.]|uniref:hypothetical protein n=1 Tax=Aestuariivita sp. TaxID=1872407 RepID=UPI00216FA6EF|nr:hypothetical protein [Aestuariivita sp.]MCE8005779.1 hypothetical protein [Aestuariivita sp.]